MQTPAPVRVRRARNTPQRDITRTRQDDPLGPAKGLLAAAGLAAMLWAGIGLLLWWAVG